MKKINFLPAAVALFFAISASAQFSIDGQIVQRAEYRHGFGKLIAEGEDPAAFIAHRARLQVAYKMEGFSFYMSAQDVRTWGNTSQVKATDPFLSVHEAWAEVLFSEKFSLKLGRQELNYDNFRFLGNLDWALQGRAHDFALLKYEKGDMKIHLGGGYNQDGQANTGNIFTVPNQYKAAQMMRYENKIGAFNLTLLFWNDGRQFTVTNSQGQVTDKGIRYRQTIGAPTLRYQLGNTTLSGFYYHQLGKDVTGKTINAFDLTAQVTQQIDFNQEKGRKLRIVAGAEILSGTSPGEDSDNHSFSPLYGTNHLFNGYMDHFFVGGGFENNVGLQDYFIRARYDFGPKLFAQLDGHQFYSHVRAFDTQGNRLDKSLGTEVDFSLGFIINKAVSLQSGLSRLFATGTYEQLQGLEDNAQNAQQWGYLMMIYRPTMKNRFIGILL